MEKNTCELCLKHFKTNYHYIRHLQRLTRCIKKIIIPIVINSKIITICEPIIKVIEPVMVKSPEYIYLVKEREFIRLNEPIYKLGKTKQKNNKRFNGYPKNSYIIIQLKCDDCDTIEKELLEIFTSKYKKRYDIGSEYFEGNEKEMITDILTKLYFL